MLRCAPLAALRCATQHGSFAAVLACAAPLAFAALRSATAGFAAVPCSHWLIAPLRSAWLRQQAAAPCSQQLRGLFFFASESA